MYRDFMSEYAKIRQNEVREIIENNRRARTGKKLPLWRERLVRGLMDAAFAIESEASWRVIWERMSAPAEKPHPNDGKRKYVR